MAKHSHVTIMELSPICICGTPTKRKCRVCAVKHYCTEACEASDAYQHHWQCTPNDLAGTYIDEQPSDREYFLNHRGWLTGGDHGKLFQIIYEHLRSRAVSERISNSYLVAWIQLPNRIMAAVYITQEPEKLFAYVMPETRDNAKQMIVTTDDTLVSDGTPAKSHLYVLPQPENITPMCELKQRD